jgi:hypothetical protein
VKPLLFCFRIYRYVFLFGLSVFDFLCPHIVEVSRRNAVSLKEKIAASRPVETESNSRPGDEASRQACIDAPLKLDLVSNLDDECPGPLPGLNDPLPQTS